MCPACKFELCQLASLAAGLPIRFFNSGALQKAYFVAAPQLLAASLLAELMDSGSQQPCASAAMGRQILIEAAVSRGHKCAHTLKSV